MRRIKSLVFVAMLLLSSACAVQDLAQPRPASTPTVVIPSATQSPPPAPTATALPPTHAVQPVPAWVTDFADPILVALVGQPPAFKDDFSGYNLGWLHKLADSQAGPFYAPIQDETLLLQLPYRTDRHDSTIFNSNLIRKDFVLSLDFKFGKTEPHDALRFQFDQAANESVVLDLSKHEDWRFVWSLQNSTQSSTGTYDYFSPEFLNVTIIMKGRACAVFLNHDPLDYWENCRTGSVVAASPLAVTIHLLSTTGRDALVTIDNVKLWDLDKVPGLR